MRRVRKDLSSALSLLELEGAELSILFVGSQRMKRLNTMYRGISKETDVLSFPMGESQTRIDHSSLLTLQSPLRKPVVLGDIVISVPKAAEQATSYGSPFYEELLRLLIHGLLHLLGYDHEKSGYQKRRMERKEKEVIHAVSGLA